MLAEINPEKFQSDYEKWGYKNTTFLIVSLLVFAYFADSPLVRTIIERMGEWGYAGAFLAGIFFVSTFTVAPAAVVLYHLAGTLAPIEVALLAGMGGVIGDYLIFRFLRDRVLDELSPALMRYGGSYLSKIFKTPYVAWLLPFIGALIIASPLPDEAGISILGIAKLKSWQFLILTLILNSIGIFIIMMLAQR